MRPHLVDWLTPWVGRDLASLLAPSWFTFIGLAGLVGTWLVVRAARRRGEDVSAVLDVLVWGYLAAVAGGILGPLLGDVLAQWRAGGPVRLRWPGMTSYWGYAAGFAAVVVVVRRSPRLGLARFGDLAAAPLGASLVLARLGCFVAGCDYGAVSSAPWAVRFPAGSDAWRDHVQRGLVPATRDASLPVHPSQLYEALLGVAIVAAAVALARTRWARRAEGRVFLCVAAIYAVGRTAIESTRGDAARGLIGGASFGQVFCAVVVVAVATALCVQRRRLAAVAIAAAVSLAAASAPASADTAVAPGAAEQTPVDPYAEPHAPKLVSRVGRIDVGLRLGASSPLNRRARQVPMLGGGGLEVGVSLTETFGVGLELDALANTVATHQAFVVTASHVRELGSGLLVRGNLGFGSTSINFEDPAFHDVVAFTYRVAADFLYPLGKRWMIIGRPATFDFIHAPSIGGTIASWQVGVGVSYRLR